MTSSDGCVPFEVDVLRVARTARDGVHTLAELPDLLPRADVVILIVPGTSETTRPRRRRASSAG